MVAVADHAPMHVRNNMIERDIILTHQPGRELRGAIDGEGEIAAPIYTHFDPDGRPVSVAFVISMFSAFVGRQALVNGMIVHSEMPGEKSSAIVTASEPLVHGERVMKCVGARRRVVGRMNSDECRTHRPMQGTPAFPRGDEVLRDFQFGCTGGRRAADAGASVSRRTGRKRSPSRTTEKNPNVRSFTVTIPTVARVKRLKAARRELCRIIRHSRKRNDSCVTLSSSKTQSAFHPRERQEASIVAMRVKCRLPRRRLLF